MTKKYFHFEDFDCTVSGRYILIKPNIGESVVKLNLQQFLEFCAQLLDYLAKK